MKNEFDNKLTDKGWKSMLRLLDRELPEQRRRRRFGWWPLALLLLPLAGAGGWWLWRQSNPVPVASPPIETPKVSEPVVNAENQSEQRFDNFKKVVKSDTAAEAVSNFPKVAAYSSDDFESSDVLEVERHSSDDSKSSDELTKLTASGFLPVQSGGFDPKDESMVAHPTLQKGQSFSAFDPLPVLLQFVETGNKTAINHSEVAAFQPALIKKQTLPRRWSFGLAAGLASENFSSLNGFSAGGAVDWQFHRKWGLRSGLQYAQYRLSTDERPVVSLAAEDYTDATGNLVVGSGTSYPYQDADTTSVFVPVEQLRQLEMPLLAYWQPVRALRIYGGVTIAYNLSAQASEQNYSSNQFYYASTQDAKNNLNKLASSNIQRWQTNLQTGLGLRLGKHFELGAFYKYGLGDLKSDDGPGNYDASFSGNGADQSTGQKGASHYFLFNGIWFF